MTHRPSPKLLSGFAGRKQPTGLSTPTIHEIHLFSARPLSRPLRPSSLGVCRDDSAFGPGIPFLPQIRSLKNKSDVGPSVEARTEALPFLVHLFHKMSSTCIPSGPKKSVAHAFSRRFEESLWICFVLAPQPFLGTNDGPPPTTQVLSFLASAISLTAPSGRPP